VVDTVDPARRARDQPAVVPFLAVVVPSGTVRFLFTHIEGLRGAGKPIVRRCADLDGRSADRWCCVVGRAFWSLEIGSSNSATSSQRTLVTPSVPASKNATIKSR